jgi:hypothetical protein
MIAISSRGEKLETSHNNSDLFIDAALNHFNLTNRCGYELDSELKLKIQYQIGISHWMKFVMTVEKLGLGAGLNLRLIAESNMKPNNASNTSLSSDVLEILQEAEENLTKSLNFVKNDQFLQNISIILPKKKKTSAELEDIDEELLDSKRLNMEAFTPLQRMVFLMSHLKLADIRMIKTRINKSIYNSHSSSR